MLPSLGKYVGTITGTSGASGTLDLAALGYPIGAALWLQPREAARIVPGTVASNTPGATYGVAFDALQLFPHDLRTSNLSAIDPGASATVHVDVFVRLDPG